MTRKDLPEILYDLIKELGGRAEMMEVFKAFWEKYKTQLHETDDIFYTWNYDIRWAATKLRKSKKMKQASRQENSHGGYASPRGIWEII